MARLVAVGVLADEARHVAHEAHALRPLGLREERVQPLHERGASAHRRDEPFGVLQDVPGVLEGVALGEVVGCVVVVAEAERIEGRAPGPVRVLAAHEAEGRVEDVLPEGGARAETGLVAPSEQAAELRRAPVVEPAFKRAAHAFALDPVERVVAVAVVERPVLLDLRASERIDVRDREGVRHGLEREIDVEGAEALAVGVDDHGDRVVADHAVRLPAEVGDDGQEAHRPVVGEHRIDEAVHALRHGERVERVRGAEGVPEREAGVVGAGRRGGDLRVAAAIAPVNVRKVVRLEEEVVEGGVERGALRGGCARDREAPEKRGPLRPRGADNFVEAPPLGLGGVVLRRPRLVHRGYRGLHDKRSARRELQHPARALLAGVRLRERRRLRPRPVEDDLPVDAAPQPGMRAPPARQRRMGGVQVVRERDDRAFHVVRVHPLEIDEQLHGAAGGKGVAVDADARRRGQLGRHARVRERDGVEAGAALLRADVLGQLPRAGIGVRKVVRERQKPHIRKVRATRAAQMGLGEAVDERILPHVARTVVPVAEARVGTRLHERKRARRPRERVPAIGAADARIHAVNRRRRRRKARQRHAQHHERSRPRPVPSVPRLLHAHVLLGETVYHISAGCRTWRGNRGTAEGRHRARTRQARPSRICAKPSGFALFGRDGPVPSACAHRQDAASSSIVSTCSLPYFASTFFV